MAAGRCGGCGRTGDSRVVDKHIAGCAKWAELYRRSPDKALAAEEEHRRWSEEDRMSDHQERIVGLRAVNDGDRAVMARRFARPDPLREDEDDSVG